MLDTAGLSKEWWGEAILTACHVLNCVPTKNKEITPFEEWEKKRPTLSYFVHGVVWPRLMCVAKMASHAIFQYTVLVIDINNTTLGLI